MSAESSNAQVSSGERILAFMAIGTAAVAFVSLMAVLIAPLAGATSADLAAPIWSVLLAIAYIGFPLALVLMIALLIWRMAVQRRANRAQ